jgi:hypothetical protein
MKNLFYYIFIIYFVVLNCDNSICNYQINIKNKEECQNINNIDNDFKCCYVEYIYENDEDEKVEVKKCHAIKNNIDEINDYQSGIKMYTNNKVLCNSNFISIKIIFLIITIIFF